MELIDREELFMNLPNDLPYKASVKRVLIQAPVVEAEPVRHGKWIKTSEFMPIYCCSECKERNLFDSNGNNVLSDHCPKCGAKMMDGE